MPQPKYFELQRFPGEVVSITDGDTLKLRLDLGFGICSTQKIRLYDYSAPETHGDERKLGLQALRALKTVAPPGTLVVAEVRKGKSFDRWIASISLGDEDLVSRLVSAGWGRRWLPPAPRIPFLATEAYPLEVQR